MRPRMPLLFALVVVLWPTASSGFFAPRTRLSTLPQFHVKLRLAVGGGDENEANTCQNSGTNTSSDDVGNTDIDVSSSSGAINNNPRWRRFWPFCRAQTTPTQHNDHHSDHHNPALHQIDHRAKEKASIKISEKVVDQVVRKAEETLAERTLQSLGTSAAERSAERAMERVAERTGDRLVERAVERSGERAIERVAERAGERALERTGERALERTAERTGERIIERAGERIAERAGERIAERTGERIAERTGERIAERAGERVAERAGERIAERSGERVAERAGERIAERAGERAGTETGRVVERLFGVSSERLAVRLGRGLLITLPALGGIFALYLLKSDMNRWKKERASLQQQQKPEEKIALRTPSSLLFLGAGLADGLDAVLHFFIAYALLTHISHRRLAVAEELSFGCAIVSTVCAVVGEIISLRRQKKQQQQQVSTTSSDAAK